MNNLTVGISLWLGNKGKASATVSNHSFDSLKEWLAGGDDQMAYTTIPAPEGHAAEAILQMTLASPEIAETLEEIFRRVFEKGRKLGRREERGSFKPHLPKGYIRQIVMIDYYDDMAKEDVKHSHYLAWPTQRHGEEKIMLHSPSLKWMEELTEGVKVWSYKVFNWVSPAEYIKIQFH